MSILPQDDLLGHQTPAPFAIAGQGHANFTERLWYTLHPIDGAPLILDIGLGYYPNRGVMDAFAGVTLGRMQTNFRCSRRVGSRPLTTEVGDLRIEVLEGMKKHRISLAANPSGLSFELEFEASFPPAREKQSYRERKGVVEEDLARVAQFGRYRGWFMLNGQRHEVQPDLWWGQRDRSWGIRAQMLTDATKPPVHNQTKFLWTWSMFQFEDLGLSLFLKERDAGRPYYLSGTEFSRDPHGSIQEREVVGVSHDIQWADDPLGQTIDRAEWHFEFNAGPPRMLRMEGLLPRYYLKAGMYGGYQGWNHGDDMGEQHSAHDVWDLDDPKTRDLARTVSDHMVKAYTDGKIGYGISEYGVAEGYERYASVQKFPAI
jgi:hypothetical protein